MTRAAAFVLLACLASQALAADAQLSPAQETRYQALLGQLRCLVCQNQSIAESNAPLAEDLRQQVRGMIQHGDSDTDIKHYLTDRYGDFVLYKPPFRLTTWLLWLGPFLLLVLGLVIAMLLFRRKAQTEVIQPQDAETIRRILEDQDS